MFGINAIFKADVIDQEAQEQSQILTGRDKYLEQHVGEYEHPTYGTIQVTLSGNLLKASYGDTTYIIEYKDKEKRSLICSNDQGANLFFYSYHDGCISEIRITLDPGQPRAVFTRKVANKFMQESYLQQFVGRYEDCEITLKNGRLTCPNNDELLPLKPDLFAIKGSMCSVIEFIRDDNWEVSELEYRGSGVIYNFKKIKQ